MWRVDPGTIVPAKGPVASMNLLSGLSGSVPGLSSLNRMLAASPRPPKYLRAVSGLSGSVLRSRVERFTRRTCPPYPLGHDPATAPAFASTAFLSTCCPSNVGL